VNIFWLVFALLLWGFFHSLFAAHSIKALASRLLGPLADHFYRLFYNIFAVLSFGPVLVLAARADARILYSVPLPWSALMVAGELLAVLALLVAFRQTDVWEFLGLRQLGTPEEEPPRLFTGGLYHYVRHPLYTAGLAFIWLLPYMTVNVLAINAALTVYVVIGALFEEAKLRRLFGQEYVDYAAVTPMLIPFTKWTK
jgi:protein-S-isoprenylcysteine O-methyltransferase Ste14